MLADGRQSKCHYPLDEPGGRHYEYARGHPATTAVAAIDLKKHYPVKKGMFAPERLLKRWMAFRLTLNVAKRWQ